MKSRHGGDFFVRWPGRAECPAVLAPAVALLFALIAALAHTTRHTSNEFLSQTYAGAVWVQRTGKLDHGVPGLESENIPGYTVFAAEIMEITGMAPEAAQFLPIGTFAMYLATWTLLSRHVGRVWAGLLAIYGAVDVSVGSSTYGVFAYGLSFPLYLLLLSRVVPARTGATEATPRSFLIVLLLFAGAFSIHYTTSGWMIIAVLIVAAWRITATDPRGARYALAACAAMIIYYISFNKIVYGQFRARIVQNVGEDNSVLQTFIRRIGDLLGVNPEKSSYLIGGGPETASLIGWSTILQYLLILALFASAATMTIHAWRRGDKEPAFQSSGLIVLMAATFVADATIYSVAGRFSIKYIPVVFPALLTIAVLSFRRTLARRPRSARGIAHYLVVLVVLVSLVRFASMTVVFGPEDGGLASHEFDERSNAGMWALASSRGVPTMVADVDTTGKMHTAAAKLGRSIHGPYLSENSYGLLVHGVSSEPADIPPFFYVTDDLAAHLPQVGVFWQRFLPLDETQNQIDANPLVAKPYTNGGSSLRITIPLVNADLA